MLMSLLTEIRIELIQVMCQFSRGRIAAPLHGRCPGARYACTATTRGALPDALDEGMGRDDSL
jgi:hypothetical protein